MLALTSGGLPLLRVVGPRVMIVEEFGQLLAQAFIPLGLVAENDGPFEQGLLKLLRQIAPKLRGRRAEDEKVTLGVAVRRGALERFAAGASALLVRTGRRSRPPSRAG